MKRRATSVWNGSITEGKGTLTTTSGALQQLPYSTAMRFTDEEGRSGTNPEELIAAAHAGCFNMALSGILTKAGHVPDELRTEAVVTIEKEADGSGWTVRSSALKLRGKVPGMDEAQFRQHAEEAKKGCPVSRALGAIDVSLDAALG